MVIATDDDLGRGPAWKLQQWNVRDAKKENITKFRARIGPHREHLKNLEHGNAIIVVVTGDVMDFSSLTHSWNPADIQNIKWLTTELGKGSVFLLVNGNHRRLLMQDINEELLKIYEKLKAEKEALEAKELEVSDAFSKAYSGVMNNLMVHGEWIVKVYCWGE